MATSGCHNMRLAVVPAASTLLALEWQQMDLEYSFWQMLHPCTSPKVVYQHTKYHKQTKNQWARDEPAFVVIFCILLIVATSAYCAAYGENLINSVFTVISVAFFDFLLSGIILATCCWFLTNTYMHEVATSSHVVEQRVECLMNSLLQSRLAKDLYMQTWDVMPIAKDLNFGCIVIKVQSFGHRSENIVSKQFFRQVLIALRRRR
ncbi:protein unc-50 homolog [Zingiber officinale]|uniref:protein unc-50 homolog n=1 Tax=Zingiber officinale TaxID=94328 RepID=UPI001C4D8037|nr:protein unc-50 homolog [Zingiber officinale]